MLFFLRLRGFLLAFFQVKKLQMKICEKICKINIKMRRDMYVEGLRVRKLDFQIFIEFFISHMKMKSHGGYYSIL